jgi:hypothetical protein
MNKITAAYQFCQFSNISISIPSLQHGQLTMKRTTVAHFNPEMWLLIPHQSVQFGKHRIPFVQKPEAKGSSD